MLVTDNITDIIDTLESGGVIAFRTDTLFALSCDASNNEAVSTVYKMKQRSVHKALPIFIDSIESAKKYVIFDDASTKIAKHFWPGPLTLVLPLLEPTSISPLVHRNQRNIAIRIPDSQLVRDVIKAYKKPIIATSANISGQPNPENEAQLVQVFGKDLRICATDAAQHTACIHSTIVKPIGDDIEILRDGYIPSKKILDII